MGSEVSLRRFRPDDLELLRNLIVRTIQTSYLSHYSVEAVQFFCDHHVEAKIEADAAEGQVLVLCEGDRMVGTGSRVGREIKRVFVDPDRQGEGFGKLIMDALEADSAANGLDEVELDASLPAKRFYDRRGYETVSAEEILLGASSLPYFRMRKSLSCSQDL